MEYDNASSYEFIRILFTSILGRIYCLEIAFDRMDELYTEGVCFDGSSVSGYANVNSSDLVLRPIASDPLSALWDDSMVIVPCGVYETSGQPHQCDPIHVLSRVTADVLRYGYKLVAGFELEFFLVKKEGESISPADNGGYLSSCPSDGGWHVRRECIKALNHMGVATTTHHHEVARGQQEIGLRHGDAERTALSLMLTKHVISEISHKYGLIATFMAKPFGDMNGSGMHIHQSLWTEDMQSNLFASEKPSEISTIGEYYIGGLLKHAGALSAVVAPTVNSFKRLVPGFEAPTRIAWGPKNRTSMLRIPHFNGSPSAARVEFRCSDPTASPHLALAAIIAAGMDGIHLQTSPPESTEKDLFHEKTDVKSLPDSLDSALDELESSSIMHTKLGTRVLQEFLRTKRKEWNRYSTSDLKTSFHQITRWEIDEYLHA